MRLGLRKFGQPLPSRVKSSIFFLAVVSLACFGLLMIRLWSLQVIRGEEFRQRSENNRISIQVIPSPRGLILDRKGEVLATSRPAFHLALLPYAVPDLPGTLELLGPRVGLDMEETRARLERANAFKPVVIRHDIPREAVAYLEEHRLQFPGVLLQVEPLRNYPAKVQPAHVLGYVGEVNEAEIRQKDRSYRLGDFIGRQGLERDFEDFLRGVPGRRWVEVDAFGREQRVLNEQPYGPGKNLILTLDASLQEKAESLLGDTVGTIIAVDPRNGEVLAMASQPRFDPNAFAGGISVNAWKELTSDALHPLEDRATRGQYPPGSVFKIAVAAAALQEGAIKEDEELFCPGHLVFGGRTYRDWRPEGHGWVNIHQALVESCDVFFWKVGLRLGIDAIARHARAFGLGDSTGLRDQGEKEGIVPSPEWKLENIGEPWYPGETLSASIGQGYTVVTPIQMAVLISAIANEGTLYEPRLVLRVEEPDGRVIQTFGPKMRGRLPIQPQYIDMIRRGLRGVVNEERGTGSLARIQNIQVAGKTGTAQVIRLRKRHDQKEQETRPRELRDHGWFVAFAPYENATIAVVVLGEHGGLAGGRYAPLAREVIAHHLNMSREEPGSEPASDGEGGHP